MIQRLLIANRSEIACRIMRTAQQMGIHCIAIYSDADRHALHVRMADEAWYLGASAARDSYLNQHKILNIATQARADALHPGYGFLAENADFALACRNAGLTFVGPSPEAMQAMASKAEAKARMQQAEVPLIPGYHGAAQDEQTLLKAADALGFPILIKASAGGGGKGMRTVRHISEFIPALQSARREALNAFGDDRILLEKWIYPARHIEVQILADQHGHIVPLFDRDCSIQRRHQKVMEEAPAPGLSDAVRTAMAQASVRAAQAVGYVNAGTLEFLVDSEFQFYFMEMNTRLQVEHPVTECITGLDLVEWQLRIAQGESLPFSAQDLKQRGAAVEVRLYAEDPAQDFLPSSGLLQEFTIHPNPHLRLDSGFNTGDTVSDYYDTMLAKCIAWGAHRTEALHHLNHSLSTLRLRGVRHNGGFLQRLTQHPDVLNARQHTNFIANNPELFHQPEWIAGQPMAVLAAVYLALVQRQSDSAHISPWLSLKDWRLTGQSEQRLLMQHHEICYTIVLKITDSTLLWFMDKEQGQIQAWLDHSVLHVESEQQQIRIEAGCTNDGVYLYYQGDCFEFQSVPVRTENTAAATGHWILAPMNGRIIEVSCTVNQPVHTKDVVIIMEAMKMEHRLRAPRTGLIEQILTHTGDLVQAGQTLITLQPE